ncbi:uncharacterized protein LOC141622744 [Silene latifolia]|uniref:uncharacterized protein LOC141622744 n=1 Tax=Silene latifolia TaxID=37657 RepID=UPI003D789F74
MVRRDSTSFVSIYNDALWAENSLKEIENEARATSSSLGKRPLYPSSRPFTPSPRFISSPSDPNKRRFVSNVQANRGGQSSAFSDTKGTRDRLCYNCKKPAHPGKCFIDPIICFTCNKPGHKANVCPERKVMAPTTPVVPVRPVRPKGRIFVMSRAEAEAHPDIITGEGLEDEFGDSYIVEDSG